MKDVNEVEAGNKTLPPECFTSINKAATQKMSGDGRKFYRFDPKVLLELIESGKKIWCLSSTTPLADKHVGDFIGVKPVQVSIQEVFREMAAENVELEEALKEAGEEPADA